MKKETIREAVSLLEDNLIEEAINSKGKGIAKHYFRKWVSVAAVFCILISFGSTVWAVTTLKKDNLELYIRKLSPDNINLSVETEYKVDKFLEALKSDDPYYQYIAINRLIESFNDTQLREKVIKQIQPFIHSEEIELAEAASLAVDILSEKYESKNVYKLADESVVFTLFNHYSDYGSYNEIWRIAEGKLEKYFSFSNPSMYITEIIVSPDGKKIAVTTSSNKSEYVVIFDIENGRISPELVSSARIILGAKKGYDVFSRIDNENYSGINNINWVDSDRLYFNAILSYNDTEIIEEVSMEYNFDAKLFNIE